ncbi:MAG: hypothetical protein L6Q98_06565 [Anaerolineae bacterium]|nr:hypothetical protein [Anaerolineae bacterium]NUQ02846.1 hypothetical protein [Anaerolineae bacterium]
MTPHFYTLYGLHLRSTGAIHGLRETEPAETVDLDIIDGIMPDGLEPDSAGWVATDWLEVTNDAPAAMRDQTIRLSLDRRYLQWRLGSDVAAAFALDGSHLYTLWSEQMDPALRAFNLFGPALGMALRLKGVSPLHASVVDIGDSAIAIAGRSGMGKSTLAAAFERVGCNIRSDDLCVAMGQQDGFFVPAGPPRVRLLPDAAEALYGGIGGDSVSDSPKLQIPVRWLTTGAIPAFQRLDGVYLLTGRSGEWAISEMPRNLALFALLQNMYLRHLTSGAMRQMELVTAGALTQRLPVFTLQTPQGHDKLKKLCREIISRHS